MKLILGLILMLMAKTVLAHPGHGFTPGFGAGFIHPLTGWDHLLVMVALGMLAAKQNGLARWRLPLIFMGVLLLGAILGMAGMVFPSIETAVAASVMAMGLLLVVRLPISPLIQTGLVGLFALLHGLAHGAELNHDVLSLMGMLLATGLLHLIGICLGSRRIAMYRPNLIHRLQTAFAVSMVLIGGLWMVGS